MKYSVQPNRSGAPRTGIVHVGGGVVELHQEAFSVALENDGSPVLSGGGSATLRVKPADPSHAWKATANVSWIKIPDDSAGVGEGEISYSVEPFHGLAARRGIITVDGVAHMVVQQPPTGTPATITTIAGPGWVDEGGRASDAYLRSPSDTATDPEGRVYIADPDANRVYRAAPDGTITTFAGTGDIGFAGDQGPATSARLNRPGAVAVDRSGNVYIADVGNHRIRKVSSEGIISTIAGNGIGGYSGDGGPATGASLSNVAHLAVDTEGGIIFSDFERVRRVDPAGTITTLAGNGKIGFDGDGGPALDASFDYPNGLAVSPAGEIFVADIGNNRIRAVSRDGQIRTVAGNGADNSPLQEGPATQVALPHPNALAIDSNGRLLITTWGGIVAVSGGSLSVALKSLPAGGGNGSQATMTPYPVGVSLDPAGKLYFVESITQEVWRVEPDGKPVRVTGVADVLDDVPATLGRLYTPMSVAFDAGGNLLVVDFMNHRVRTIGADGQMRTLAGTGVRSYNAVDNVAPRSVNLVDTRSVAVDEIGNVYIGDGCRILEITAATGLLSKFAGSYCGDAGLPPEKRFNGVAGNGQYGNTGNDGPATEAQLAAPLDVALDAAGNLFIAGYSRISRVSPDGIMTALAEDEHSNRGIAVDGAGTVFATSPNRLRLIGPDGSVTVIAGGAGYGYGGDDGPASESLLNNSGSVAIDDDGNIYVADTGNNRIRRLSPANASDCSFRFGTAAITADSTGRTGFAGVYASNPGCNWTASTADFWIAATVQQGQGSAAVQYRIAPNPGMKPRTGKLMIGGAELSVWQAAQ